MIKGIPSLKEGETKVFFLRRHWIVPVKIIVNTVLFFLLPIILWFFFGGYLEVFLVKDLGRAIFIIFLSIYYLSIWLFFYHTLIDYWLDVWIVTTRRILHIEQRGLFYRTIAELELSRIQDLTSSVRGIVPTFLGYGTIFVQTAAELPRFIFRQIPNPETVRAKIMELVKKTRSPL